MVSNSVTRTTGPRRTAKMCASLPALLALTLLAPGCNGDRVSASGNALAIATGAAKSAPAPGTPGVVQGFIGAVFSDDPRATLAGRDILSAGGSAGDAAVAMGWALTVTLSSRAGVGGGAACLAYSPEKASINGGVPEAILFPPLAPSSLSGGGVDRPAAIPMFARGMFYIHHRYGRLPFEVLVQPAETMARQGTPVSRAFARDLAQVATPLFADPAARAIFGRNGQPLQEGQTLLQPDLGGTLAQIRVSGVGDLYQGNLARKIEAAAPLIGASLTLADMQRALPQLAAPVFAQYRSDKIAFLPPPVDPGLTVAAFQRLQAEGGAAEMEQRNLPASSTFGAVDPKGNAVVCAATMNNLFGTGRIMPGMGFLAAASPTSAQQPILSAGLAWNERERAFRAAAGGSGQYGAGVATAMAIINTLRSGQPMAAQVPDPGRANVIACNRYLPGNEKSCAWATDPRETGLAAGGGG